ncbi:MAG: hypothetical protein SFU56_01115 [Capsulimonadales bacterium]|nr:hypothetical protein [Capsulimonadales bacterium]
MDEIEKELRYWFNIEDWYPSTYTKNFLARTPREDASDLLAHIAQDAECQTPTVWWVVLMAFLASGFSTSTGVAGRKITDKRAGIRAALHLSTLDDPRAIAPLARVWQTDSWKKSKYQDEVETALIRLFERTRATDYAHGYSPDVTELVYRAWKADRWHDLSNRRTDLLLAALHYLGGRSEEEERAAIRFIADQKTQRPNRTLVRDTARELLEGKKTPVVARMVQP